MLPKLHRIEPVPHEITGFNNELLPFIPLSLDQLRVVVAQADPAESDVPRFVFHHWAFTAAAGSTSGR